MMRPKMILALPILILTGVTFSAYAEVAELTRLKGFSAQEREGHQFDKARLSGEKAFLEEEEQWVDARDRAAEAHKQMKKDALMSDEGPEARADEKDKARLANEYDKNRLEYRKEKESFDRSAYPGLVTESQELGLDELRPRFDFKKRMAQKGGSSGGSSSGGSGFSRSATPNFPPPPATFDDFGSPDGGFVPAPNVPEDFGDVPPPPPPVSFPDEGFGGGADFGTDFIPPPPPPFDGEPGAGGF